MQQENNKKIGFIGTVIFHVAAVIIMFLFGFVTPLPLPEEEGILINFGVDDAGSGDIETQLSQPISAVETQPQESNPVAEISDNNEKEILTQDYEETAVMEERKRKERERKLEEEKQERIRREEEAERRRQEEIERQREEEQRRLDEQQQKIAESAGKAFGIANTNSQSDGTGGGFGNQGDLRGSPDSRSYEGSGQGKQGISYSLAGRKPYGGQLPTPNYPNKEEGVVVIKVKVDKNGYVKEAVWEAKGSTTTNKQLVEAATKAALKARFNQDESADLIQVGTITYRFSIK
ncbi:MAG TPA: TonB family protein [Salinivirgaceae bacterium]|nr:TonB family protein [Salinivirgaceae bacterium]